MSWANGIRQHVDIDLQSTAMPSYTWRLDSGAATPGEAAVPAYYLAFVPRPGAATNADVLRQTPILFSVRGPGMPSDDGGVPPDDGGVAPDDGGIGDLPALATCLAHGMEDPTAVLAVIYEAVAAVDDPRTPPPETFASSIDLDDDGTDESHVSGTITAPQTTNAFGTIQATASLVGGASVEALLVLTQDSAVARPRSNWDSRLEGSGGTVEPSPCSSGASIVAEARLAA